jgi:hypothetical protein
VDGFTVGYNDDDDDVYLDRITQHRPKNYLPYVKYRPARKGISIEKERTIRSMQQNNEIKQKQLLK